MNCNCKNANESYRAWNQTACSLPPENIVIETKISDCYGERNICDLIRIGNLFYQEDMKMYVYYLPTHWRIKS